MPINIIPSFFLNNKYTKWYYRIIEKAQNRTTFEEYGEIHHIIPKSLGGSEITSNKIKLTAREHFICHWLLVKMNNGEKKAKMVYAFWCICNILVKDEKVQISSKTYENIREQFSKTHRLNMSSKQNPFFNKHHTNESKKLISINHKDVSGENNPMFGVQFFGANNHNFQNHILSGNNNPNNKWNYIRSDDKDYWTDFTEKDRKICRGYFSRKKSNIIIYKNINITRILVKK